MFSSIHTTIFEVIMLICFGFAWPVSIVKSIKSKSTRGKSIIFSFIILVGYASGLINNIINGLTLAFPFYILNFIMVFIDMLLWFRNRSLEKAESAATIKNTPQE